jgi:CheY-like chemotaxis protein
MLAIWPSRAADEKRPDAHNGRQTEIGGGRRSAPGKRRVLVIEDNLDTVRSLALLLREMGHEVEYAINGYAGIEVARRFKPDVIILDLGLPGMDGFDVCRRLKKDPELSSSRVVALTGYAQEDYRERALKAGCEQHFVKPIDASALEKILN